MKIAYIRSTFPKNSETFILEEILYLKRAGHEIRIFAKWCDLSNLNSKILDEELLSHVIYDGVGPIPLSNRIKIARLFLRQWVMSKKYRSFFRHDFFVEKNMKADLRDFVKVKGQSTSRIASFFKRVNDACEIWFNAMRLNNLSLARQQYIIRRQAFEPEHIHCPFLFPWDSNKLQDITSAHPTIPYTVTLRSRDMYLNTADPKYLSLRNRLIVNASAVFTISEYNKSEFSKAFDLKRGLQIVHSSIDSEFFSPDSSIAKIQNQMVSVARLVPKKGLDILIDACAILQKANVPFNLSIIGDGELKSALLAKIAALGLQNKVCIIGPFRQKKIKAILSMAEVFVLPCLVAPDGDRDILPNSIKEAMAMKLVVVTTSTSGIEELVTDSVTGLLARPDDPNDLADKIICALSDKVSAHDIGEKARQRVLDEFSISGEGRKFELAISNISVARAQRVAASSIRRTSAHGVVAD